MTTRIESLNEIGSDISNRTILLVLFLLGLFDCFPYFPFFSFNSSLHQTKCFPRMKIFARARACVSVWEVGG